VNLDSRLVASQYAWSIVYAGSSIDNAQAVAQLTPQMVADGLQLHLDITPELYASSDSFSLVNVTAVRAYKDRTNIRIEQARTPLQLQKRGAENQFGASIPMDLFKAGMFWERRRPNSVFAFVYTTPHRRHVWGPIMILETEQSGVFGFIDHCTFLCFFFFRYTCDWSFHAVNDALNLPLSCRRHRKRVEPAERYCNQGRTPPPRSAAGYGSPANAC
jgi:hypothetical protein